MSNPKIIFLKTPSTPTDGYETKFSSSSFSVHFLSVISHTFLDSALDYLKTQLDVFDEKYGGLIFTSQRAVDGFLSVYTSSSPPKVPSEDVPVYVVGPATHKALTQSPESPFTSTPSRVIGQETGSGEALAEFILEDRSKRQISPSKKLLFLVGEKRRDIIPKRLAQEGIEIEELEVYVTIENPDFEQALRAKLKELSQSEGTIWIVVFSPQGCQVLKDVLAEVDSTNNVKIATIGPTTAAEMEKLGRKPEVIAEKPSPEGLYKSIESYS